jgi:hypothetical protein
MWYNRRDEPINMPFDIPSVILPLWLLLVLFGLYMLVFFTYTAFNLYHLLRFGTYGIGLYSITALFLVGTVALVAVSVLLLVPYDWSLSLSVSDFFGRHGSDQFFPGF